MRIIIILLTMAMLLLLINIKYRTELVSGENYCDKVREEHRSSCFYFK